MANDDDWKRRRAREDEEEKEAMLKQQVVLSEGSPKGGVSSEKLDELMQRADVLIDQLNNLYNMYVHGAEKLPPTEKRKQLDQIMVTVTYAGKPTPSLIFKSSGIISRYTTHKEKWNRLIKDLESGKIKRLSR